MDSYRILGMSNESFYALLFILLLVILGIVSFHYYAYLSSGNGSALRAGAGIGFNLLPGSRPYYGEQEQH